MSKHFLLPPEWMQSAVRVALIGAGGTGSQLADALASMDSTLRRLGHPGLDVTVFDGDTVSASNVGRSRFCGPDVGNPKATLLVHRLNMFYGVAYRAVTRHFQKSDLGFQRFDLIVTCTDKAKFRVDLSTWGRDAKNTLWLDTGNRAVDGQCVLGHLGQGQKDRLPNIVDLYRAELSGEAGERADEDQPSCSTAEAIARQEWSVNRTSALVAADLLWALFRQGRITHHGAHFRVSPMQVTPLPIDPATWAFFGYDAPAPEPQAAPAKRRRRVA
jgi:PRTRC genetic system ThiF family protein